VIKNRQDEIVRLHAKYSGDRSVPDTNGHQPSTSPFRGDAEIVESARSEKNGKFDRLWQGDTADYGHDHSAADDAFVHKLWPYTQDEEQIRRIHTMSGLHRPEKSGRRPDYLRRSIERARKNVTWFYEWPGEQTPQFSSDGSHDPALPSTEILSDHPIESGFGQKESLPLKTPKDIIEAAKDGTDYIVEGLLAPGELTDLAGLAKLSGKTTFITHMVRAAIEGEEFIGLATRQTRVLIVTEQGNNFADALVKSGLVDAGDALRIVQQRDLDSGSSRWDKLIEAAIKVCKRDGFEVLVIDTFAGLSGLRGTEENQVGSILEKLAPLKAAAHKYNLAVLLARHAGKDGKGRGSSIFEGEADIVLTFGRPEGKHKETARVLEGIGRHDDIPSRITIELTDKGYVSQGSDDKIEFNKAVRAIRDVTPHNPNEALTENEILDAAAAQGTSRTTLRRALEGLMEQDENLIKWKGKGKKGDPYRYWQPSREDPPN
jgi:hypothetical protein